MPLLSIYSENNLSDIELNVDAIAAAAELDWEIVKKPALYYDDDGKLVVSNTQFVLCRENGLLTELDTAGKDLKPMQPKELISVFVEIAKELDLHLISAGHTRGRKYIYLIASTKEYQKVDELEFQKCLFFSTTNDGNGKTKIRPISINTNLECQITQSLDSKQEGECYSLSHHYNFNIYEAIEDIKEHQKKWDSYFDELELLSNFPMEVSTLNEFHHKMFKRFDIGNSSTKRKYEIVMKELMDSYISVNKSIPHRQRDTAIAALLAFNNYIDFSKHRKGGISGKIHAINFANDDLTKRTSFYALKELIAKNLKN
jgi:hypothetical protein